jgi:hypothetical protein
MMQVWIVIACAFHAIGQEFELRDLQFNSADGLRRVINVKVNVDPETLLVYRRCTVVQ